MTDVHSKLASSTLTLVLAILFCAVAQASGQDHVVPLKDLQQEVISTQNARESHLNQVHKFFSSPVARKALKKAQIEPSRIDKAVSQLNDEELARLASRTEALQNDFRAGALTNQEITYILIAVGTALLVTIIFVAK